MALRNQQSAKALHSNGTAIVLLLLALYFFLQALLTAYLFKGAAPDNAEQLVNTSYFDWGYGGSQPPIYTWVCYAIFKVVGPSLLTLQIIKFSFLAATFYGVYAGLRCLDFNRNIAVIAMLSLFILPQIGWESQRSLTHSVAGTAGCAWTFAAFAFHLKKNNRLSLVLFGFAIAWAMLGKFNDGIFILAIFLAALTISQYRKTVLSIHFGLSILIALIVMAPTLVWMMGHRANVLERANKFAVAASGNPLMDRIFGISDLIQAVAGFCGIVLLLCLLIFLFSHKKSAFKRSKLEAPAQLMVTIVLIGLFLTLMIVVVSGATNVKDRWMQPVLFLSAPTAVIVLNQFGLQLRQIAMVGLASVIFAAGTAPVLAIYVSQSGYDGEQPLTSLFRYDDIDLALKAEKPFKTVIGADFSIPGNLRRFSPDILALTTETPDGDKKIKTPAIVIWADGKKALSDGKTIPIRLYFLLKKAGYDIQGEAKIIPNIGFYAPSKDVVNVYYYRIE